MKIFIVVSVFVITIINSVALAVGLEELPPPAYSNVAKETADAVETQLLVTDQQSSTVRKDLGQSNNFPEVTFEYSVRFPKELQHSFSEQFRADLIERLETTLTSNENAFASLYIHVKVGQVKKTFIGHTYLDLELTHEVMPRSARFYNSYPYGSHFKVRIDNKGIIDWEKLLDWVDKVSALVRSIALNFSMTVGSSSRICSD